MKVIEQDLLTIDNGTICHAVNTNGVMEAGLAKVIVMKYPEVYETYVNDIPRLSEVQLVHIHSRNGALWVANLATQDEYGHKGRFTQYSAVEDCLHKLSTVPNLYFPWKFGCGLGGGNWNYMMGLLLRWVPDATICYFRRIHEG